mgnify:CR=1 FL=1
MPDDAKIPAHISSSNTAVCQHRAASSFHLINPGLQHGDSFTVDQGASEFRHHDAWVLAFHAEDEDGACRFAGVDVIDVTA